MKWDDFYSWAVRLMLVSLATLVVMFVTICVLIAANVAT
jgi:hypothetical protein